MSINSSTLIVPYKISQQPDFAGLKNLEEKMNQALIDQPEAVNCVAEMIKRIRTGFYDEAKPLGVLVFAGPTGVGKTELAKMTAYEMGVPLHRFDMSEFSERHKVSRLLGSPAGYVNSDQGGELVNKLKATPECVVLFDEIEKAHPDIHKIFLQLFDEGRLTDSMGQEVRATKAIFILTSNLGSHEIYQQMQRGVQNNLDERLKALYIRTFSIELYNRFDKVIVFRPLTNSAMERIVEKYMRILKDNLAKRTLEITWDQQVVVHLSALNVDVNLGARDIHRKIKEYVLPKLTASRIEGKILQTDVKIHLKIVNGQLELAILDKGKAVIDPQHIQEAVNPKSISKRNEAITLKDGVVYLDFSTKRPLKELEGKYVCRMNPNEKGDRSYIDDCIKIAYVTSTGEIVYETNERFIHKGGWEPLYLSPKWNDGQWRVVTPAKNGRAFFENICTAIVPLQLREEALILTKKIFSTLNVDCHLSEKAPFASLREYCVKKKKEDLIKDVEALEKLIGPFSVTILTPEPELDSNGTLRSKL